MPAPKRQPAGPLSDLLNYKTAPAVRGVRPPAGPRDALPHDDFAVTRRRVTIASPSPRRGNAAGSGASRTGTPSTRTASSDDGPQSAPAVHGEWWLLNRTWLSSLAAVGKPAGSAA